MTSARHERFKDLYRKIATAREGSEELDAMIVAFFAKATLRPYPPSDDFGPHDHWQFWSEDGENFLGNEHKFKIPPLTRSVDAALAAVPSNWRVVEMKQIARSTMDGFQWGWAAFLMRQNERISPVCSAFIGMSDGWTPTTAALALTAVVAAARYAEEVGEDVYLSREEAA